MLIDRPGVGLLHHDAPELDRMLREGDGVGWPGDPHLVLELAVVKVKDRSTRKMHTGRRYEVWRACEDGQDRMIGHWTLEEKDRILHDLARMRVEAPEHEDVVDVIARKNEANERVHADVYRDSMGEMLSHLAHLRLDRSSHDAKTTFRGIPGRRDG